MKQTSRTVHVSPHQRRAPSEHEYTHRTPGHIRTLKLAKETVADLRASGASEFSTHDAYLIYLQKMPRASDEMGQKSFGMVLRRNQVELGIRSTGKLIKQADSTVLVWTWREYDAEAEHAFETNEATQKFEAWG